MKQGVVIPAVPVLLVLVVAIKLGVVIGRNQFNETFGQTFVARCKRSNGTDCERIWSTFERAYVGKNICKVPTDAYDPLFELAPINKNISNAMFWSKTKDVVHAYIRNTSCFVTMENTLLGSVLDGLNWCGKEGSKKTFTDVRDCQVLTDCKDNPVHSFWRKGSACFAQAVSGHATVMLNGSVSTPFNTSSVFASIEVPNLNSAKVKKLTVVLVVPAFRSTCLHKSLGNLKDQLTKRGIAYECKEVSETRIMECGTNTGISCTACW